MSDDNVIPLVFRAKPRPQIGRWTAESIALDELFDVILDIANDVYCDLTFDQPERRDRYFATIVLAACANALYSER